MLERHDLLVRPWTRAVTAEPMVKIEAGAWVRAILDPETDRPLGFAHLKSPLPAFVSWLGGQSIRVYETDDASLLATVRQPLGLGRRWRVWDADEHPVGSFYGMVLQNQFNQRLAELEDQVEGEVFQGATGVELGWVHARKDESDLLHFNKYTAERSPFVRMVMLGFVICRGKLPG
ncbi:MAG: hypothetical protein HY040_09290 [Planctomycetes bacterium]|nr:hypothetical protein [Planctomycetota bacterium]